MESEAIEEVTYDMSVFRSLATDITNEVKKAIVGGS